MYHTLWQVAFYSSFTVVRGKGLISSCEIQGCQNILSFEHKGHFIASCCAFIFWQFRFCPGISSSVKNPSWLPFITLFRLLRCSRSLMGLRQYGKWPVISDPPLLVEAATVNSHSESPPPSPLPTPGSSCPPQSSFPLKQLKARGNFFTTTKFTSNTHTVTGV